MLFFCFLPLYPPPKGETNPTLIKNQYIEKVPNLTSPLELGELVFEDIFPSFSVALGVSIAEVRFQLCWKESM